MEKTIKHIAIIPDGNRRWARQQGWKPWKGHQVAVDKLNEMFNWMEEFQIKEFTVYCFSMQNFQRDQEEVDHLMEQFHRMFDQIMNDEKVKRKVRINFIGRTWLFDQEIQDKQQQLMDLTRKNSDHAINFAMGYGGQEELIDAVKKLAEDVHQGIANPNEIDNKLFSQYLYLDSDPDIVIRTSGEQRLSNFLPWQSSYSELFFIKKYWPDFSKEDLKEVIEEFQNRKRRFGK